MTLEFYVRKQKNRRNRNGFKNLKFNVLALCYNQQCKKCDEKGHESWAEIKIPENKKINVAKRLCK